MKKMGFAAVLFSMVLGASLVGCGSSACDDYKAKVDECCDKLTDATAKDLCKSVSAAATENADNDACQAALDVYKCTVP